MFEMRIERPGSAPEIEPHTAERWAVQAFSERLADYLAGATVFAGTSFSVRAVEGDHVLIRYTCK